MTSGVPDDEQLFNALMECIDQRLREEGLGIAQRPVHALRLLSEQFHIPLPLAQLPPQYMHASAAYWPITERAYDWYDKRYGEKLKIDFTLGKIVVKLDGDLWAVRVPRLIGSGMFVVLRTGTTFSKEVYNILDLVEAMPPEHAATLSQGAFDNLYEAFHTGFAALSILNASKTPHPLIAIALEDARAAVLHLTGPVPAYGPARWASLQVAEKVIKAAIALSGHGYSKNHHNLEDLEKELREVVRAADISALIPFIQCSAKERYGERPSSEAQALAAHLASLRLVSALHRSGAPFKSGISSRPVKT